MRGQIRAFLAAVAVAAVTACSPIAQRTVRLPLVAADCDGDGRVSHDEFVAWMSREGFARIDTNQSGTITWDEWRTFEATSGARRGFEALDTDHDEHISPAEWTHDLGRSGVTANLFMSLDRDRDEVLSWEELDQSPALAPILSLRF